MSFLEFIEIAGAVSPFVGGWQWYRFRRPFFATTKTNKKNGYVRVVIQRRYWFEWPAEARDMLRKNGVSGSLASTCDYVSLGTFRPNALDDEKLVEDVVAAKNKAAEWSNRSNGELKQLERQTKRMLKR